MKWKELLKIIAGIVFIVVNYTIWHVFDKRHEARIESYKQWELAHNVYPFDTDLLEYYKEYYYVTELLLDSLDTQYHWKDYCKSIKYFEAQDIVNQYLNCCHE